MSDNSRCWWAGPLNVEQLAWDSVRSACDAAQGVADAKGLGYSLATSPELVRAAFAAIDHLRVSGRSAVGWGPLSGFFRTTDGWVRTHGNYPHHAEAISRAIGANSREELSARLAGMASQEASDNINAENGVATVVRTKEQWENHAHHAATRDLPWETTDIGGERSVSFHGDQILGGLRVLDLTRVIAGPTCSQLLASLGAEVLRIDPPGRPELTEQYISNGMGKVSVVADFGKDRGFLEAQLGRADVVLLGYRPGALQRFGLEPEQIRRRFPDKVIASFSAWGEAGPWGNHRGFDSIVQASCGISMEYSDADGVPGALPVQALDHSTGYRAAARIMQLLGDGLVGNVRVNLLGAARTLLSLPAPVGSPCEMPVPTVSLKTAYGDVIAVPPALTVNGRTLEAPIRGYGLG